MTVTTLSLTELVDLSLGTPEVVNYKGLRTLLLAIVSNLKLGDVKAELNDSDKQELLEAREASRQDIDKRTEDSRPTSSSPKSRLESPGLGQSSSAKSRLESPGLALGQVTSQGSINSNDAYLQNLEHKVSKLENQMEALNTLPSNDNLMQRVRSTHQESSSSNSPVSEMWQLMQVQKKAAANEDGVGKLMSMVEDMMRNVQDFKDKMNKCNNELTDLKEQIDKLNSTNAELKSSQDDLRSGQGELKSDHDHLNQRVAKLETSSADEEKMIELQKLLNDVNNRLNNLPPSETIVTWPAMENALKGIYKEPAVVSDGWIQTNPVTEDIQQQTIPTSHTFTQTRTPSPPPSRPSSSMSSVSHQPTKEIQRILKEIGSLTGKHNVLEERVKLLEELMEKKADLEDIKRLLGERQDIPDDLAKMLADLQAGLDTLHASKDKMDQLSLWIEDSCKHAPATQHDIDELKEHLERIHSQLSEDIDSLINGLPVGRAVSLSALEQLSDKLRGELDLQSNSLGMKISRHLGPLKAKVEHLDRKLDALGKMRVKDSGEKLAQDEEMEEQVVTPPTTPPTTPLPDIDGESITEMQKLILQMQAEVDRLNTTYVQLVDEHNSKQKHIDALYTFVDRLQENKADKEHVTMEIDIKADKRMLENKVSRSQFEGTVDEMTKNLNDVMSKLSGHTNAWESAVGELKLGIDNKLDRMELDPLKAYLDKRIKAVDAKVVKTELHLPEDAAGFRRPLQKVNCISCDRPLDMTPQPPLASLPESKGLPGMRSGRPYTTFELEQIRAAQKRCKPGKNVQHYERALFEQELARQRKQDILAYIVHFGNEERPSSFCMKGPVQQRISRMMFASEPEVDFLHLEHTPKDIPGELMKLKHTKQMTDFLRTKTPASRCGSHYGDLPDYFVTTRSCGGTHTMTYPHKRVTRTTNTQITAIVPTEEIVPMKRLEADIQGADGHIYRARINPSDMDKLPTIATQPPRSAKNSPRTSSARGRRQPPSSASTERTSPRPLSARPHSARHSPTPPTQSNTLEVNMNASNNAESYVDSDTGPHEQPTE